MTIRTYNLGQWLTDDLALYDPTLYSVPETIYWAAGGGDINYFPRIGGMPLAVEELKTFTANYIGEGAITDGQAFDIPQVDAGIEGSTQKAVMVIAGAQWSFADVERAKLAAANGRRNSASDLTAAKMNAVTVGINRRVHRLGYAGASERGFGGMFNSSRITAVDQTGAGNLYGASSPLTATQLTDWLRGVVAAFKVTSMIPYSSIVVYVEDALYTALCKPIADNTGDTPFMRLTSPLRGQFVGAIMPITELNSQTLESIGVVSDGDTRGRLLLGDWRNSSSVYQRFATIDRTDPFVKDTGVHYGVTGVAAVSELIVPVPERFEYVDYAHS